MSGRSRTRTLNVAPSTVIIATVVAAVAATVVAAVAIGLAIPALSRADDNRGAIRAAKHSIATQAALNAVERSHLQQQIITLQSNVENLNITQGAELDFVACNQTVTLFAPCAASGRCVALSSGPPYGESTPNGASATFTRISRNTAFVRVESFYFAHDQEFLQEPVSGWPEQWQVDVLPNPLFSPEVSNSLYVLSAQVGSGFDGALSYLSAYSDETQQQFVQLSGLSTVLDCDGSVSVSTERCTYPVIQFAYQLRHPDSNPCDTVPTIPSPPFNVDQ